MSFTDRDDKVPGLHLTLVQGSALLALSGWSPQDLAAVSLLV
jgi:hypothetical protein